MALKSVDDVEVGGFDDELSTTEIAYLAKNFRNFLRNNNRKARGTNTAEPRNFRKNDPTKVNNNDKPREKVGQSSNSFMGSQCFGCQGYGRMKSECLIYLKSKGKAMAVTLNDGEVSDDESKCDEDGNFIAFIATAVVNESISAKENPSDGELSEDADLQEAYNKLCKVTAKDAMNVELGLKKIESLGLDKKNLLVKLFDANELLNNVKTENMLLLDKVISLELDLFVARSTSSKLDQLLKILILGKLGFKTCVLEKHFISYSCIFISFFNALRCVFKNQVIFSKKYFSRFSIDPNCFSINRNLV